MTVDAWVINASPLTLYSRIGRLDLIEGLARLVERETDCGTAVSHLFILGDTQ